MSKQDGIGTWVWNNVLIFDADFDYNFSFTSDSVSFNQIHYNGLSLIYGDYTDEVYHPDSGWTAVEYRTIDIKTAPSADFLTILQANATYQEPAVTSPKYLDADALKQFATKMKAYVDDRTKSRITNVVIDDTAKTIKLTIE